MEPLDILIREITLPEKDAIAETETIFDLLDSFQGSTVLKSEIFQTVKNAGSRAELAGSIPAIQMPESWRLVLTEQILDTF